jgi:hypothetical protein
MKHVLLARVAAIPSAATQMTVSLPQRAMTQRQFVWWTTPPLLTLPHANYALTLAVMLVQVTTSAPLQRHVKYSNAILQILLMNKVLALIQRQCANRTILLLTQMMGHASTVGSS